METKIETLDVCRTCLSSSSNLVSVFITKKLNDEFVTIAKMLQNCTNIDINENDELSCFICNKCIKELLQSYLFRMKCIAANDFLKKQAACNKLLIIDEENDLNCIEENLNDITDNLISFDGDDVDNNEEEIVIFNDLIEIKDENIQELVSIEEKDETNDNFLCNHCGALFITKSSYTTHMSTHKPKNKKHVCEFCSKNFVSISQLEMHKRKHTGEKPFECEICGKTCSQQSSLKVHMRIHTGETPYKCETCGIAFRTSGHRLEHMRGHSTERPFKCTVCGRGFTKRSLLRDHRRIHSNEKKHKCEYCSKTFTHRKNLVVHEKIHTNDRQHICQYCGKRYIQRHCLNLHLTTHNKDRM